MNTVYAEPLIWPKNVYQFTIILVKIENVELRFSSGLLLIQSTFDLRIEKLAFASGFGILKSVDASGIV